MTKPRKALTAVAALAVFIAARKLGGKAAQKAKHKAATLIFGGDAPTTTS